MSFEVTETMPSAGNRRVVDAATGCGARLSGISLAASISVYPFACSTGTMFEGSTTPSVPKAARIVVPT